MKFKNIFPFWGTDRDPLTKPYKEPPHLIIANRKPCEKDKISAPWWYDRSEKTMYRATQEGYIED